MVGRVFRKKRLSAFYGLCGVFFPDFSVVPEVSGSRSTLVRATACAADTSGGFRARNRRPFT